MFRESPTSHPLNERSSPLRAPFRRTSVWGTQGLDFQSDCHRDKGRRVGGEGSRSRDVRITPFRLAPLRPDVPVVRERSFSGESGGGGGKGLWNCSGSLFTKTKPKAHLLQETRRPDSEPRVHSAGRGCSLMNNRKRPKSTNSAKGPATPPPLSGAAGGRREGRK